MCAVQILRSFQADMIAAARHLYNDKATLHKLKFAGGLTPHVSCHLCSNVTLTSSSTRQHLLHATRKASAAAGYDALLKDGV